jgi:ankyrin repeat protein
MMTNTRNHHLLLSLLYKRNVDFSSGWALSYCVEKGNETGVRLSLEFGASVAQKKRWYLLTRSKALVGGWEGGPLHFAKTENMAKLLLSNGADVNHSPDNWGTPLHVAAEIGNLSLAKLFIENKAHVDHSNVWGITPLHVAAERGHLDVGKLLLDHGACVNTYDMSMSWSYRNYGQDYGSPLHFALQEFSKICYPLAKLLVERGADVGKPDIYSATPLHIAAKNCTLSTIKLLLDHGALVNVQNNAGVTPLHNAAGRRNSDTMQQLCAHISSLHDDIDQTDLPASKLLLDHGALVNVQDNAGNTPLHEAAGLEVLELLVGRGAQVNVQNKWGATPLHGAMELGHLDRAKLLLDHGAQVNMQNKLGFTALHSL